MNKKVLFFALAGAITMSSCVSKKELVSCQESNKTLQENLQAAKEDLAGKNARITSLEEQAEGLRKALSAQEVKYVKIADEPPCRSFDEAGRNLPGDAFYQQVGPEPFQDVADHFQILLEAGEEEIFGAGLEFGFHPGPFYELELMELYGGQREFVNDTALVQKHFPGLSRQPQNEMRPNLQTPVYISIFFTPFFLIILLDITISFIKDFFILELIFNPNYTS